MPKSPRVASILIGGSLGLYAVGVAVSQSLMSLGGSLVCLSLATLIALKPGRLLQKPQRSLLLMFAYILWTSVQLLLSNNPYFENRAWSHIPLYLVPFLGLFASSGPAQGSFFMSSRIWRRILHLWLMAFTVSCFYAVYQGLLLGQMATGWLRNPIYFAYNVLFQIVCFATLFKYSIDKGLKDSKLTQLLLAAIFLGVVAIFFSNSRMVMLCSMLILGAMILPILWGKGRRLIPGGRASILIAALTLGGTAFYEYHSKPYVQNRVHNALNLESLSWQGRLRAWDHNRTLIAENPLSGVGMLQNGLYTKELEPHWQELWGSDVVIYAHNIYLQILAESGIIGLVLLFASLILFYRCHPSSIWLLMTLMLSGLTENALSNSKSLHSFLFCLLFIGLSSQLGELKKKS